MKVNDRTSTIAATHVSDTPRGLDSNSQKLLASIEQVLTIIGKALDETASESVKTQSLRILENQLHSAMQNLIEPEEGEAGEKWRDVPHYKGLFKVSDQGRIWSCQRDSLVYPSRGPKGFTVQLYSDRGPQYFAVHRLVAIAFVANLDPMHKAIVWHINGNREDNRAKNLEWVSNSQLQQASVSQNRESRRMGKYFEPDEIKRIRAMHDAGQTIRAIAEQHNVGYGCIRNIILRITYATI